MSTQAIPEITARKAWTHALEFVKWWTFQRKFHAFDFKKRKLNDIHLNFFFENISGCPEKKKTKQNKTAKIILP